MPNELVVLSEESEEQDISIVFYYWLCLASIIRDELRTEVVYKAEKKVQGEFKARGLRICKSCLFLEPKQ